MSTLGDSFARAIAARKAQLNPEAGSMASSPNSKKAENDTKTVYQASNEKDGF